MCPDQFKLAVRLRYGVDKYALAINNAVAHSYDVCGKAAATDSPVPMSHCVLSKGASVEIGRPIDIQ